MLSKSHLENREMLELFAKTGTNGSWKAVAAELIVLKNIVRQEKKP